MKRLTLSHECDIQGHIFWGKEKACFFVFFSKNIVLFVRKYMHFLQNKRHNIIIFLIHWLKCAFLTLLNVDFYI